MRDGGIKASVVSQEARAIEEWTAAVNRWPTMCSNCLVRSKVPAPAPAQILRFTKGSGSVSTAAIPKRTQRTRTGRLRVPGNLHVGAVAHDAPADEELLARHLAALDRTSKADLIVGQHTREEISISGLDGKEC